MIPSFFVFSFLYLVWITHSVFHTLFSLLCFVPFSFYFLFFYVFLCSLFLAQHHLLLYMPLCNAEVPNLPLCALYSILCFAFFVFTYLLLLSAHLLFTCIIYTPLYYANCFTSLHTFYNLLLHFDNPLCTVRFMGSAPTHHYVFHACCSCFSATLFLQFCILYFYIYSSPLSLYMPTTSHIVNNNFVKKKLHLIKTHLTY